MTHLVRRLALILAAGVALPAFASPDVRIAAPAVVGQDAAARTSRSASQTPETYTVRRGDTLAKVAVKLGSDIETLADINGLKKPYRLNPGQVLKGPRAVSRPTRETPRAESAARPATDTYVVKRGDTLFSIANRFDTTVSALQAENGLGRSASLTPGRKLRLPGGESSSPEAEVAPEPREVSARPARSARSSATPAIESGDRSVTGRVVNIETPGAAYRVKKGDTLEKIARRLDSEIDDLARINKLKRPYRLQPGQTIRGPGSTAKAYVVGRGDTLAEIARRFGVSVDKLRSANGLRRGASVAPGRKLRLPAGYRDRGPIVDTTPAPIAVQEPSRPSPAVVTPPPSRPSETPGAGLPSTPQPYVPPPRPTRRPSQSIPPSGNVEGAPVASPPASDAQITQMGAGRFTWPIRGEILSGFGSKGTSQRNDGLNIRANAGDPVRSAADGDIVYAGDQVPGFGNLVLVKHADGWVTAYGHLSRVSVRMQQRVSQGQEIGQVGSSGGVSEPQLHFEVRFAATPQERARPIDPSLVLPR